MNKNPFLPKAPASKAPSTTVKGAEQHGFAASKGAPKSKPGVASLPKLGSKAKVPQMGKSRKR